MSTENTPHFEISLQICGELRDFLKKQEIGCGEVYRFAGRRSVKDLVESLGIPHTEVGGLSIDGVSVPFSLIVANGRKVEVRPHAPPRRFNRQTLLQERVLPETRFILDVHLGTLARRMRMLGFDTSYSWRMHDPELARLSEEEQRILVTRDRRLLMRRNVHWGMFIRNKYPVLQTAEILNALGLWEHIHLFSRCIACNGVLRVVEKDSTEYEEILAILPDGVTCWCTEYSRCKSCRKIYWEGSHFEKMESQLAEIYRLRK